jgi:UDP-3-O-[3-hydroxymyristoyl] glucosamine N-acyltransferase
VVLGADQVEAAPEGTCCLVAEDPYFAFREAVVLLHGFRSPPSTGISAQAHVDPSARVADDASIGPWVWIGPEAEVGAGAVLHPGAFVGARAWIGEACVLYPNVVVYEDCVLGDRVVLQAGCVIGQDGFGYATHEGAHHKIPHVGNAVVESDVEMGAHCAVDRATLGATVVGAGTKCSDGVVIGHGARVGRHNLLVAQVGIAGSASTGDYVVMGGQCGVAGHLHVGDGAQLAGGTGVMHDLSPGRRYGGVPARHLRRTQRVWSEEARLPEMRQEMRLLQRRLAELERRLGEAETGGASEGAESP